MHDGVFIVPQYFKNHEQHAEKFSIPKSYDQVALEYCSGNGDWIVEKAKEKPEVFWIAVEKQFPRVRKIWSKMKNDHLSNLLIVCGEAQAFTCSYLPSELLDAVFVNFPDPWPKKRHAKHRLIQSSFTSQLARVIKKGGKVTYATDHEEYSKQMIDVMHSQSNWSSAFPKPYFLQSWQDYGESWFQKLWQREGRQFYYMQWENT